MWVQPNVICLGGWSLNLRDVRERLSRPEEDTGLRVPSAPTLSRARLRLDVLMMQWRAQRFKLEPEYFIYLSSDSSPQGGRDFLMSIEDSISRHHASLVVDGNPQALARLSLDPWVCKVGNFPLNLRTLFGSYYMSLISDFCWGKNRDPITRLITNARRAHCGQEPFRSASLALGIAMLVQNLKHYFKVRLVSWTRIPFALRGDMSYVIFPEGVIWMNFTTNDQWWMIRFRSTIIVHTLRLFATALEMQKHCRNIFLACWATAQTMGQNGASRLYHGTVTFFVCFWHGKSCSKCLFNWIRKSWETCTGTSLTGIKEGLSNPCECNPNSKEKGAKAN